MLVVEWVWVVAAGYRIDVGCEFWVRVGMECGYFDIQGGYGGYCAFSHWSAVQ